MAEGPRQRSRLCPLAKVLVLAAAFCLGMAAVPCVSADTAARPHGYVYRVTPPPRSPGHELYLYGTLHVGRINGPGLDAATVALVAQCQHVALELDPRNALGIAKALQTYAIYPSGDRLADHVSRALDQHAMNVSVQLKLPADRAEQLRPWVLANFLSVLSLARSGFDPRRSSESLLAAEAARGQADVTEVEGADLQMKLLGGAPEDVQVDALERTLGQIDDGHISDEASTLLDAWDKSDVAAIEGVVKSLAEEKGAYPHFMSSQLLDARNQFMADAAIRDMNQPGVTLFAVGVLHLFGQSGLIAELERRGYKVSAL